MPGIDVGVKPGMSKQVKRCWGVGVDGETSGGTQPAGPGHHC